MRSFSLRPTAVAIVTLAAAVSLTACSGSAGASSGSSDTVTVNVGTLRGQPHFYHPFLYEQFAADDVQFNVITLDTTPALNDALVSGTIDFAITGVTPTISSIAQGRDLKIVASAADGGSGFIGNDSIESVDDLVGKNVGYIQGSAQEVALRLKLEEAGVDADDVDLQVVPVPDMANAFGAGDLDAFFGVEIGVSIAKANGGHEISDPYDTPIGKVNIGLVTTGALIESDPDLVQDVIDTHEATVEYMNDNQDEWLTEMVNTFGGNQTVLDSALENFWLRSDLPNDYQDQLESLAVEMEKLGLIESTPTADELVDAQFVDSE